MIGHPAFPVEAWQVTETAFSPEVLAQAETVFTLANGYLGLRGNLDEGSPAESAGTYLNGFYESRPIIYGERHHAFPPTSETQLNVTDGKVIRLTVEGAPFDVRTGTLHLHRRVLDLRGALLRREVVWEPPGGGRVAIRSVRFVSLSDPHLAAVRYEVEALDRPMAIEMTSALVANESNQVREGDPREAAPLYGQVLLPEVIRARGSRAVMVHTTRTSRLSLAAAMDHRLEAGEIHRETTETDDGEARVVYGATTAKGAPVRLVKLLVYHWSADDLPEQLAERARASLEEALELGFERLVDRQRRHAQAFWARTDVVVEGDVEVQQGLRFGLFQVLQAVAHAGDRGVAAKGLTGQGYEGHRFWDSEVFLVPLLAYTNPEAAKGLLEFRYATLGAARERARELGLSGALFPWRTISGTDVSPFFPAGTAGFHLAAGVAYGVTTYTAATGDDAFRSGPGAELLVETARLWISLGHHDSSRGGAFCLSRVTGPDEYSALVDNNVYTNLMAAKNLAAAADLADELQATKSSAWRRLRSATGLDPAEPGTWRRAAESMYMPYDAERGIHPQDEAFLHLAAWDPGDDHADHRPLLLDYHPLVLYQHQVIKQADLVLALHLAGERFSLEQKRRNFAYYDPITVHDSSLSAATHAVVAAEIGELEIAEQYVRSAALIDLGDLAHNVHDGIHVAAVAGSWTSVVAGLGGFRHTPDGRLLFAPKLPSGWRRLAFRLRVGDGRLRVEITPEETSYRLISGHPLVLLHHGQELVLAEGSECRVPTGPRGTSGATEIEASPGSVPGMAASRT
ncbi:MAG: glycoside hydrolase family 65 protein [Acidimicrobiales bacterium]|nr:glycoside hydrolase family 65 protein [Acidimicrobiales bacterium]